MASNEEPKTDDQQTASFEAETEQQTTSPELSEPIALSESNEPPKQTALSEPIKLIEEIEPTENREEIELEPKPVSEATESTSHSPVEVVVEDSRNVVRNEESNKFIETNEGKMTAEAGQDDEAKSNEPKEPDNRSERLNESPVLLEDQPLFFESKSPNEGNRTPSYGPLVRSLSPSPPPRSRSRSPSKKNSRYGFYESRVPGEGDQSPRYQSRSRSSSRSRSPYRSDKTILCRFYVKKSGCMRGDKCNFHHPGAVKGPELVFCTDYQMGNCRRSDCDRVHAGVHQQENYEHSGILPSSVRLPDRFCTWSWMGMNPRGRQRDHRNNKVIQTSDSTSLDGSSMIQDLRSFAGKWDSTRQADGKSHLSDVETAAEVICEDKESLYDRRVDRKKSESSYYESSGDEAHSEHILKIKQVPLDASVKDIEEFLHGYRYKAIHQHTIDGSSIGVFYVEFDTNTDLLRTLDKNSKRLHPMDKKSVEVVRADVEELKSALEESNINEIGETEFVRIKGVPEGCTELEVEMFFEGLRLAKDGIVFPLDYHYKRTANCYVKFESTEDAQKALQQDGQLFASKVVKVLKSSKTQFENQVSSLSKQKLILGSQQSLREPGDESTPGVRVESEKSDGERSRRRTRSSLETIFPYYFNQTEGDASPVARRSNVRHMPSYANSNKRSTGYRYYPKRYYPASPPRPPHRPYSKPYVRPYNEQQHYTERPHRPISPYPYRPSPRRSMSPVYRESSYRPARSISPERSPAGPFFYESHYNTDREQTSDLSKRMVKVTHLPCNTTREDLFKFFEQLDLKPRQVDITVDRVRKTTEADVEFGSLSDAKKSFMLGGARLRTKIGGYCRQVEIFIHPELASVNVINPLSHSITTKYDREKSMYKALSEQIFPFETDSSSRPHLNAKTYREPSSYESDDERNEMKHKQAGELLGSFLTNNILIDQLKNSIMRGIRKQERLSSGEASDYERERSERKKERTSREKHHLSRSYRKTRSKYSDSESSDTRSSEKEERKKERSSSHRKHEKSHKHKSSHHKSHRSRKHDDEDSESPPRKRRA